MSKNPFFFYIAILFLIIMVRISFLIFSLLSLASMSFGAQEAENVHKTFLSFELSVGKKLPTISGDSLLGEKVTFPHDVKGKNVVLLVGFTPSAKAAIEEWKTFLTKEIDPAFSMEKGANSQVYVIGMLPKHESDLEVLYKKYKQFHQRHNIEESEWGHTVLNYDGEAAHAHTLAADTATIHSPRVILIDSHSVVRFVHLGDATPSAEMTLAAEYQRMMKDDHGGRREL
eukprot:TRINITY_DN5611_c0_g1_i1.p1 TRINITY_DN5611_c0_g1~~TRINITY_DN5611_c0_g1_i1.p1  ORF type:complete len:229 (-),score=60.07 TRINITY_DN5611_c0_g1_i1:30-716(-)